jgi:LPS export ABC transporter protein LptC
MSMRRWVVGLVVLAAGCKAQATPTGEDFQEVTADLVMVGMTSYLTNNGIRKAHLFGDTAFVYDDSSKVFVKKVNLKFFDENGEESGSLTSRDGDFNTTTQAMLARGSVVLITKTGNRRIETEELHYDPQSHRIWSTVKTLMIQEGDRVTGSGFSADDKFQNVSIKDASGRVRSGAIKF